MTAWSSPIELLEHQQDDLGHEALRLGFLRALTEVADQAASIDDVQLVLRALTALGGTSQEAVAASLADRAQLHATDVELAQTLALLALRVVALEQARAVRTVAMAPPVALGLLQIGSRDITLPWDRALPDTSYDVDLWPSVGLGGLKLAVKSKTATGIVVTVTTTTLLAAGGSLGALAWRSA